MLSAILAEAGANFGEVLKDNSPEKKGYYEAENLIAAVKWFDRYRALEKVKFPYPNLLKKFCFKKGSKFLKAQMERADFLKLPAFSKHVGIVKKLGYQPVILGVWRDFFENARSYQQKNGTDFKTEKQRWIESNYQLLFLLQIYEGCLINFEEINNLSKNDWAKKIVELTNLEQDKLLIAREKVLDKKITNKTENIFLQNAEINEITQLLKKLSN